MECFSHELIQRLQFGDTTTGQLIAQVESGSSLIFNFQKAIGSNNKGKGTCSMTFMKNNRPISMNNNNNNLQNFQNPTTTTTNMGVGNNIPINGVGIGYVKNFILVSENCHLLIYNNSQSTRQQIVSELVNALPYNSSGCFPTQTTNVFTTSTPIAPISSTNSKSNSNSNSKNTVKVDSTSNTTISNFSYDKNLQFFLHTQSTQPVRSKGGIIGILNVVQNIFNQGDNDKSTKETTNILVAFNQYKNPISENKNPITCLFKECDIEKSTFFEKGVIIIYDSKMVYKRPKKPFLYDSGDNSDNYGMLGKIGLIIGAGMFVY